MPKNSYQCRSYRQRHAHQSRRQHAFHLWPSEHSQLYLVLLFKYFSGLDTYPQLYLLIFIGMLNAAGI